MIQWKNAHGLADKLARLGAPVWTETEGDKTVLLSPDDAAAQAVIDSYTLAEAQDALCADIDAHATALRDRALAPYSVGEMVSWPVKLAEAKAGGSTPMLSAEAAARGVSLAEIIAKVGARAAASGNREARIAGVAGKHKDAARGLPDFDALNAYDWHAGWPNV